jgi:hypothetical protein
MAYVKQNATSIYTDGLLRKYVNLGQQQKKQKKNITIQLQKDVLSCKLMS